MRIPGFHDNQNGTARGANTIIGWTQGGLRFAHFGDYGQDRLSEAQLADLRDPDVVLVPAGGFFTIDAVGAAALINELKPRVAVLSTAAPHRCYSSRRDRSISRFRTG